MRAQTEQDAGADGIGHVADVWAELEALQWALPPGVPTPYRPVTATELRRAERHRRRLRGHLAAVLHYPGTLPRCDRCGLRVIHTARGWRHRA